MCIREVYSMKYPIPTCMNQTNYLTYTNKVRLIDHWPIYIALVVLGKGLTTSAGNLGNHLRDNLIFYQLNGLNSYKNISHKNTIIKDKNWRFEATKRLG